MKRRPVAKRDAALRQHLKTNAYGTAHGEPDEPGPDDLPEDPTPNDDSED